MKGHVSILLQKISNMKNNLCNFNVNNFYQSEMPRHASLLLQKIANMKNSRHIFAISTLLFLKPKLEGS